MIRKQDILDRAAEWGLRPDVVEKDYVLAWLLVGLASHPETRPVTRALRRSALARLLYFYVDKARRHHLSPEAHERLRHEIGKLLVQGDGYAPAAPERPDSGYVFCPELRTVEFERLYLADQEAANLFLVGTSYLPDSDFSAATPSMDNEPVVEPGVEAVRTTVAAMRRRRRRARRAWRHRQSPRPARSTWSSARTQQRKSESIGGSQSSPTRIS